MTTEVVSKILRKIVRKIEIDQSVIKSIFKVRGSSMPPPVKDKDIENGGKTKV